MSNNVYHYQPQESAYMRLPDILCYLPVSKATWWNWVATGKAPSGIKLGRNITVWKSEDIHQFLKRIEEGL